MQMRRSRKCKQNKQQMDPIRYLALADLFKVVIDILGPWSLNSGNRAIVAANDQRSPDGCQVPSACSASSVGALWQIACERDNGIRVSAAAHVVSRATSPAFRSPFLG